MCEPQTWFCLQYPVTSYTQKSFQFGGASPSPSIKNTQRDHRNSMHVFINNPITPDTTVSFISIFHFCPHNSSPGTHCGYIIPPILVSASDTISVTFQSDSRLTDRGFSAKWEAVYPEDITGTKDTHTHTHREGGRERSAEAVQPLVRRNHKTFQQYCC